MRWPWQKPEEKEPPKCSHKYKDFPWYMQSAYYSNERRIRATITEPFVCLLCKDRKDLVLMQYDSIERSREVADEWLDKEIESFRDKILPKAVVEDMIADMQLVDHEFLKYYEMMHGDSTGTLKIEDPKEKEHHYVHPDQLMQWIMARSGIEPYASHFKNVRGWEVHTIKPLDWKSVEEEQS